MKPLLLFIVFTVIASSSFSQKIKFTDTTNHWITGHTYFSGTTFSSSKFSGTTTLSGVDYLILNGQMGHTYLIREDTTDGKVYYREYQSTQPPIDTAEYVAYDYNWKVGDTATSLISNWSGKVVSTFEVVSIDSVLIQNVYHKVWYFSLLPGSPGSPGVGQPVIEGIGCVSGPTWPFNLPEFFEGGMALFCFMSNNAKPALSKKVWSFDNTHSCLESVDYDTDQGNPLVFPNPVTSSSQLNVSGISKGYLVICNVLGQEVYRQQLKGEIKLPIGLRVLTPGMYFYQVLDYSGEQLRVSRGSFIRE